MFCKFKYSKRRYFPPFEKKTNFQIFATSKKYQNIPRPNKFVKSIEPTMNKIENVGDYACLVPITFFGFNSVINTDLQANEKGHTVLNFNNAKRVARFQNPLSDVLIISKLNDGTAHLKDGFHRLYEAKERGFTGDVWVVVLDAVN